MTAVTYSANLMSKATVQGRVTGNGSGESFQKVRSQGLRMREHGALLAINEFGVMRYYIRRFGVHAVIVTLSVAAIWSWALLLSRA